MKKAYSIMHLCQFLNYPKISAGKGGGQTRKDSPSVLATRRRIHLIPALFADMVQNPRQLNAADGVPAGKLPSTCFIWA